MNWTSYVSHWDVFLEKWVEDPIALAISDPLINGRLNLEVVNELPEPYYCGVPLESDLDAVIINLNPGASSPNEWVKYHCLMDNPSAFISYEVNKGGAGNRYQRVNALFNPLLNSVLSSVPGKDWWEKERFNWLDGFFPSGGRNSVGGFRQDRILALEFSPWHSKSFSLNLNLNSSLGHSLRLYVNSFVIDPASDAIRRSRLIGQKSGKPYGLCFSKYIYDLLVKHFAFVPILTWNSSEKTVSSVWPRTPSRKYVERTYSLIEGKDSLGNVFRLFCLWYPSVGVSAPSARFQQVESIIKTDL